MSKDYFRSVKVTVRSYFKK